MVQIYGSNSSLSTSNNASKRRHNFTTLSLWQSKLCSIGPCGVLRFLLHRNHPKDLGCVAGTGCYKEKVRSSRPVNHILVFHVSVQVNPTKLETCVDNQFVVLPNDAVQAHSD